MMQSGWRLSTNERFLTLAVDQVEDEAGRATISDAGLYEKLHGEFG